MVATDSLKVLKRACLIYKTYRCSKRPRFFQDSSHEYYSLVKPRSRDVALPSNLPCHLEVDDEGLLVSGLQSTKTRELSFVVMLMVDLRFSISRWRKTAFFPHQDQCIEQQCNATTLGEKRALRVMLQNQGNTTGCRC